MRDIFFNTLYACSTVSLVALTLALVKLAGGYLVRRKHSAKIIVPHSETTSTAPANHVEPSKSWPRAAAIEDARKTGKIASEYLEKAADVPDNKPQLECGNCGSPIHSKPIRTDVAKGKSSNVYKCETCKKLVAVEN